MRGGRHVFSVLLVLLASADHADGTPPVFPFLHDLRIEGTTRLYYFDRAYDRATRDQRDIALGGRLAFRTGRVAGLLAGVSLHTSEDLGPESDRRAVYGLLAADRAGRHLDYTAVGEAYLDGAWGGTAIRAGRTELSTPWLNGHDIRMTPHSFEAIQVGHSAGAWRLTSGVARAQKARTSERFLDMPQILRVGAEGEIWFLGVVYADEPRYRIQAWHYTAENIWQDWYFSTDAAMRPIGAFTFFGNLRYLRRIETGRALMGPQGTWMAGITGGVKSRGWTIAATGSRIGERLVQRPWGHDLAISEQVEPCNDPRERAWLARVSYDFSGLGLAGLNTSISYSEYEAPLAAGGNQEQHETDYDLKYAFADDWEARVRYAYVRGYRNGFTAEGNKDLRFQLTHRFSIGVN